MDKAASEIRSLISLIDDEDDAVFTAARDRLLSYKEKALEFLPFREERASLADRRLAEVREVLLRSSFKEQFRQLKKDGSGNIDLEDGLFLIARYRYNDLDVQPYSEMLNRFAAELKEHLSSITDETELLRRIIAFFTVDKGFAGTTGEYYSEENHYLNRVLDTRTGIPLSLSVVYLLVGQRIDLPIRGIGLPGHFVLRLSFGASHVYFDPFNGGKLLTVQDCAAIVTGLGFEFSDDYLVPVTTKQILERVLRNIILSLEKKGETDRIESVRQFIDTLNSDL